MTRLDWEKASRQKAATKESRLDVEATALRVAGAMYELLGDCKEHRWTECIDLAAEHTESRRLAQTIAWEALTKYIDRNTVWSGPKGKRSIRFTKPRARRPTDIQPGERP
jgi:hypothetical protein